jgi:RNA polymerase sigma-70 factor (ECF subfamily)
MQPPSPLDDETLLIGIAQGDQSALSSLYDRYARVIYGMAFRCLNSVEESEEVVLDTFAQVWRIADRYDHHKGKAHTWLFTLARSRMLDRLRKLKRSKPAIILSLDAEGIKPPMAAVDLFEEVMIGERRSQVLNAMKTLPDAQKLVLELAYYHGLSQSEIVAQTGLPLGTVKTRVRLGLNKLKLALSLSEI